jgi:hypothetical protein
VATPTSGIPAGNKAPVVSVGTQSATHGQSLAGSSLLSASDPDADPIIKYQFWNSTGDPAIGYFVLNGMAEPVQQSIEVTAAQLPSFSFQSGSGNDLLWVRASDGFQWSSWQSFTVTAPVDHAPVVTASDISATHRQSFAAASLFSVTDADNDTMAKYEFWDSSDPSAGQFVVNGTSEPSNQPIDVSAADLANTSFQSGSGTALLWVRANDGMLWSSWVPFHLNAPADQAPVVAGNDTAIALNQSVAVSSLFTVMDPENDPITAYEFWNSSPDPSNGYFIANAQVQPADQVIDVSAAQLGQTRFVAGSQVGETDLIWERQRRHAVERLALAHGHQLSARGAAHTAVRSRSRRSVGRARLPPGSGCNRDAGRSYRRKRHRGPDERRHHARHHHVEQHRRIPVRQCEPGARR